MIIKLNQNCMNHSRLSDSETIPRHGVDYKATEYLQSRKERQKRATKKFEESTILPFKNIGPAKIDGKWIPRIFIFVTFFEKEWLKILKKFSERKSYGRGFSAFG